MAHDNSENRVRKLPWGKWWYDDWLREPGLRRCSLAAKGLWIDLICLMARGDNFGYLSEGGVGLDSKSTATQLGLNSRSIASPLAELKRHNVYSTTSDGIIYCRRMVRDAAASAAGREHGKTGGNPALKPKPNGSDPHPNSENKPQQSAMKGLTPPDNPRVNPTPYPPPLTQGLTPEARSLEAERYSVPRGTARLADAPDPREELWNWGVDAVRALVGNGKASAQRLVGMLLRAADDDCPRVLKALHDAQDLRPIDPKAWLMAACGGREAKSVHQQIREAGNLPTFLGPGDGDLQQPDVVRLTAIAGGKT